MIHAACILALTQLASFNAAVMEFRGEERIFVGAQLGESADPLVYAWTTCIPESGVFVIQAAPRLLEAPPSMVRYIAAHEVCHAQKHSVVLCGQGYASQTKARKQEMENEADECAARLLTESK